MATSKQILNSLDQNSQGPRTKEQDEQDLKSQQGSYLKRELLIANMLIAAKDMLKKLLDTMFVQQKALEDKNLLESDTSNNNQLQVDKITKPIINPQVAIIDALLLQWENALAAINTILQNSTFSWKTILSVHNHTQLQQQHNAANNQIFINLLNVFQANNTLNLTPTQITELQDNFNHRQNNEPTLLEEFESDFNKQEPENEILVQHKIDKIIKTFVMRPKFSIERELIEFFMDKNPGMSFDAAKLEIRRLMQQVSDYSVFEQRQEQFRKIYTIDVVKDLYKQFRLGQNAKDVVLVVNTTMQQISEQLQIINQVQYQLLNKNISLTQEQFNNLQPLVIQTNQFMNSFSNPIPQPRFTGQKKDEFDYSQYYNPPFNPEYNPNNNSNNPPYNPEYNPNNNSNNPPYNPEYNPNNNSNNPPYNPEYNPNISPQNPVVNPNSNSNNSSEQNQLKSPYSTSIPTNKPK